MPLAFPSHQGLILPIADRWRIDTVALSIGAALPDIVELFFWPIRGELGQWIGHSLLGVILFIPIGLVLTAIMRRVTPTPWLRHLDRFGRQSTLNASIAIAIGSLAHVISDFVTHANFVLFVPFYESDHIFPAWWTHAWSSVDLLVYRKPYPIAPHTIVWFLASVLGIILFARFVRDTARARKTS